MKLKKGYVWKRTGRCQPKKCGAFCCRVGPLMTKITEKRKDRTNALRYYQLQGMFELGQVDGCPILSSRTSCSALRGLSCGVHKTRPTICREFPHIIDQDYYRLAKQHGCTYRFKQVKSK